MHAFASNAAISGACELVIGAWGTFKTTPASGASKVTFMASGDVFNKPEYGIFDKMGNHAADFYISLGDNAYSDTMTSLSEYWRRMKETRDHASRAGQMPLPVPGA